MVFFWTMNIHTQLNVYMWMYLSRTVFIFVKSKKCGQNKAESSCHSPQPSGPHPSSPRYTDTRNYTHAIHANTHACTQSHQMPNSHCPRDNLQNLLSVNKQNPNLQQWQKNWCKHGFLFTMNVVSTHFPSCAPFNVFCDGCKLCLPVYSYIKPIFHQRSRLPKKNAVSKTLEIINCRLFVGVFFSSFQHSPVIQLERIDGCHRVAQQSQEPTLWKILPQGRSSWRQVLLQVRDLHKRRGEVRGVS